MEIEGITEDPAELDEINQKGKIYVDKPFKFEIPYNFKNNKIADLRKKHEHRLGL